jgi:hypothetical protein
MKYHASGQIRLPADTKKTRKEIATENTELKRK